jgi:hypothetical protein
MPLVPLFPPTINNNSNNSNNSNSNNNNNKKPASTGLSPSLRTAHGEFIQVLEKKLLWRSYPTQHPDPIFIPSATTLILSFLVVTLCSRLIVHCTHVLCACDMNVGPGCVTLWNALDLTAWKKSQHPVATLPHTVFVTIPLRLLIQYQIQQCSLVSSNCARVFRYACYHSDGNQSLVSN